MANASPPVFEVKKSTDAWLPVVLVDATDGYTAETGIAAGTSATAFYCVAGATAWTTYTIAAADWHEAGSGAYWLNIGATELTAEGRAMLKLVATGCRDFDAILDVRDLLQSENLDNVVAILGYTGTTGVKVGSSGIGTQSIAPYAMREDVLATGALGARAFTAYGIVATSLATALYQTIADYVLDENAATAHQDTGSLGEAMATIRQVLAGKVVADDNTNALQVYDQDGATLRLTLTSSYAAPTMTRTPS